jgi:hypothetical protein
VGHDGATAASIHRGALVPALTVDAYFFEFAIVHPVFGNLEQTIGRPSTAVATATRADRCGL